MGKFIGEEIRMLKAGVGGEPVCFIWRGDEHRVTEIIRCWQDWGFPRGAHSRDYKSRKHRNYFEIQTDRGFYGLVYLDRGVKPRSPKVWVIKELYEDQSC